MIYSITITIIFIILLIIVLRHFINIICFTKNDNFDKNYKATRIDANRYSVNKWLNLTNKGQKNETSTRGC